MKILGDTPSATKVMEGAGLGRVLPPLSSPRPSPVSKAPIEKPKHLNTR